MEEGGDDDEPVELGNGTFKIALNSPISNMTPYTTSLYVTWNDGVISCGEEFQNVTVYSDPGRTYCGRINGVAYALSFTIDITAMTASKLWFKVKVCQDEEYNCVAPNCD